ncbi:MAG: DsbA family protein [Halobacteriales archaeon]
MNRRAFLAAAATGVLAGCLGGGGGGADTPAGTTTTGAGMATGTATPGGDSIERHPAAAGLADQPTLGPDPFEAGAVVVAFEDPSCPRCRAFEEETVPKIESNLVEPGRGSFVFRGYPVVYPWGGPAAHALEATFDRDPAAFWALAGHYFEDQSNFDSDNVLDRTRSFLASETDLDADAVVADVEEGSFEDAVQADLDAGKAAGAGRTTPTVFLFRDGQYRTKAAGSVSYSVIENALGL